MLKNVQSNKETILYKKRSEDILLKNKNDAEAKELFITAQKLYHNGNIFQSFTNITQARDLNSNDTNILSLFLKCSNEIFTNQRQKEYNGGLKKSQELISQLKYNDALEILENIKLKSPDDKKINELIDQCNSELKKQKNVSNKALQEKYDKLGDTAFNKYDFTTAYSNYQQALKFGENQDIRTKLTNSYKKIQQKQERMLDRDEVKKHYELGMKYYSMGQYENAILEWQKVLEIDPQDINSKNNIAKAKTMLNK